MVRILKSSWNEKDVVKWFLFFFIIFWFLLLNEFYYSKKFMEAAAVGSAIVHIVVALRGRGLIFIVFCFFVGESHGLVYALVSTAGADSTFVAAAAGAAFLPLPLPLTGPNGCATSS